MMPFNTCCRTTTLPFTLCHCRRWLQRRIPRPLSAEAKMNPIQQRVVTKGRERARATKVANPPDQMQLQKVFMVVLVETQRIGRYASTTTFQVAAKLQQGDLAQKGDMCAFAEGVSKPMLSVKHTATICQSRPSDYLPKRARVHLALMQLSSNCFVERLDSVPRSSDWDSMSWPWTRS